MTLFSRTDPHAPQWRLRRLALTIVAMAASGLLFIAGPARAQQYPPQAASLTASVQVVVPGTPVTFTASGFGPGTTVTFTLRSTPVVLGTAVANANGVAVLTARIPIGTSLGNHTVTASGVDPQGRPLSLSVPIRVVAKVVDGNAPLARTGSNLAKPLVRAGLVAIGAGALLVLTARKRTARRVAS